jgi:aspartyl-tRNA(Asn)/glutamyl-tRNA(Gln) amidotransferase subunit C
MATPDEVKKLARLARIEVADAEVEKFAKEFDGILAYVGQLEKLEVSRDVDLRPAVRNVFRKDGEPHEPGMHTEKLAAQFPEREGNFLKVKQIISYE